jgi:hypothetical protein
VRRTRGRRRRRDSCAGAGGRVAILHISLHTVVVIVVAIVVATSPRSGITVGSGVASSLGVGAPVRGVWCCAAHVVESRFHVTPAVVVVVIATKVKQRRVARRTAAGSHVD